jgi:hypothetical protein
MTSRQVEYPLVMIIKNLPHQQLLCNTNTDMSLLQVPSPFYFIIRLVIQTVSSDNKVMYFHDSF